MRCCFVLTFASHLFLAGCTTSNPAYLGGGDLAGTTPSDMGTPAPPQCVQSSQCASQVCLQSGQCAAQGYAVYVDNHDGTCSGTHAGTQDDPVCTLADGLDLAAASANHTIFVAGSTAAYSS